MLFHKAVAFKFNFLTKVDHTKNIVTYLINKLTEIILQKLSQT